MGHAEGGKHAEGGEEVPLQLPGRPPRHRLRVIALAQCGGRRSGWSLIHRSCPFEQMFRLTAPYKYKKLKKGPIDIVVDLAFAEHGRGRIHARLDGVNEKDCCRRGIVCQLRT